MFFSVEYGAPEGKIVKLKFHPRTGHEDPEGGVDV